MKLLPGCKENARARVWVDGKEITKRCLIADDESGYALCLLIDSPEYTEDDRFMGTPLFERLVGRVEIKLYQNMSRTEALLPLLGKPLKRHEDDIDWETLFEDSWSNALDQIASKPVSIIEPLS